MNIVARSFFLEIVQFDVFTLCQFVGFDYSDTRVLLLFFAFVGYEDFDEDWVIRIICPIAKQICSKSFVGSFGCATIVVFLQVKSLLPCLFA